jgi:hypothetical protein
VTDGKQAETAIYTTRSGFGMGFRLWLVSFRQKLFLPEAGVG